MIACHIKGWRDFGWGGGCLVIELHLDSFYHFRGVNSYLNCSTNLCMYVTCTKFDIDILTKKSPPPITGPLDTCCFV